jgi:preprotein translocase subunit SecB
MASSDKKVAKDSEQQPNQGPAFAIQRLYVKDLSFETSNTPFIFKENWQPTVNLEINSSTNKVEEDLYEIVLRVTATVKHAEKSAFIAEVHQAGVFSLQGFSDAQMQHMFGSYCPSILFPYAREVVSDLINRGSFPPLYLSPVNFEAVYEQQIRQQQQEAGKEGKEEKGGVIKRKDGDKNAE